MPINVYATILNAATTVVQGLSLTGITSPAGIKLRLLPKVAEVIDPDPQVLIAPSDRGEEVEAYSFEPGSSRRVRYFVDFVIVASQQHDYASNLSTYTQWREQIRRAFQPPTLAGAPTVFDTEILPWEPIDREALAENYAYLGLTVGFDSIESTS